MKPVSHRLHRILKLNANPSTVYSLHGIITNTLLCLFLRIFLYIYIKFKA